jgi:hypothetical protein
MKPFDANTWSGKGDGGIVVSWLPTSIEAIQEKLALLNQTVKRGEKDNGSVGKS